MNEKKKLPPLTEPPVPPVPNRAWTEMRKTTGDGVGKTEISAPENGSPERDTAPEIRAGGDPFLGNFEPGESDGNFSPER